MITIIVLVTAIKVAWQWYKEKDYCETKKEAAFKMKVYTIFRGVWYWFWKQSPRRWFNRKND
jgi:hypothetical protein